MSITFTPLAGTWTAYSYYPVEQDETAPDLANGIIRFDREEPSVQCHNSGGLWLVESLRLAPPDEEGDTPYYGQFEGDIRDLIEKIDIALSTATYPTMAIYERDKLNQFLPFLRHCQYHGCGFSWG